MRRDVLCSNTFDRRIKIIERTLLHLEGDLRRHARVRVALIHNNEAVGLLDRLDDGIDVKRADRARVDDLSAVALLLQLLGGLHSQPVALAVRHDGHVLALTGNARLADGEDRKSTRLNSSHVAISYAVFCLKKK